MTDSIHFNCPHCSHTMQFPAAVEGKQGKCPSCSVVVTVANNSMVDLASLQEGDTTQRDDPPPATPQHQQTALQQPPSTEEFPLEMGNAAFARGNLTAAEKVLHAGRFHPWPVRLAKIDIFCLGTGLLLSIPLALFDTYTPRYGLESFLDGERYGSMLWILVYWLLAISPVVWLKYRWAFNKVYKTEFVLTNQRLIAKWGFLRTVIREIQLEKIESVNYGQTLLERIYGIGRLTVRGTGGGKVGKFTFLLDALEFRKRILDQIDKVTR